VRLLFWNSRTNTDASELERISRNFSAVINHVFHHARCTYDNPLGYLKLHNLRVTLMHCFCC